MFQVLGKTGCSDYLVSTSSNPPVRLSCPAGLVFDTTVCGCEWANKAICVNSCSASGNKFIIVPDSGCKNFTLTGPNGVSSMLTCPDELLFDTSVCVCNKKDSASCYDKDSVVG